MNFNFPIVGLLLLLAAAFCLPPLHAWEPGTYPAAPARMHSSGFSVDTSDRNDVIGFWHAVYMASEGYEGRMNWTGTYSSTAAGAEGTTSADFVADVERRVNYFRAMAGLPADSTVNSGAAVRIDPDDLHQPAAGTLKSAAAQRAAFVVALNTALFHNPPTSFSGWTAAAWNGSHKGNLAWGTYGPGAITEYLREELGNGTSGFNSSVGHRRWILYPQSTNFATGDVPASAANSKNSANCLYVMQRPEELRGGLEKRFVSYPPTGYFPAPINSRFWSLSYPGADFSTAKVSMTDHAGNPVATTITVSGASPAYGDRTIAWEVAAAAAIDFVVEDATFHVTVSGIKGAGVPPSHQYSVTLINPDRAASDQTLTGTGEPAAGIAATYFFSPPPGAEAVSVTTFRPTANTWTENAETGNHQQSRIIDGTATSYPLISTAFTGFPMVAGVRSFRLSFPYIPNAYTDQNVEQHFELDRQFMPLSGASLHFKYKRGFTTESTGLLVETSNDDGAHWITAKTIVGRSDNSVDSSATSDSIPLPAGSLPLRVRFRLVRLDPGLIYAITSGASFPTGFFIDDIGATGGEWLAPEIISGLPAGSDRFVFKEVTPGALPAAGERRALRMRTKLGNRWLQHGPVKSLQFTATPVTGYDAWEVYEFPVLTQGFAGDDDGDGIPNGVEYAFSLDPLVVSSISDALEITMDQSVETTGDPSIARHSLTRSLTIRRSLPAIMSGVSYGAEWSDNLLDWSAEGVSVATTGGTASANVPAGNGRRFLRWKIDKD